MTRGANSSTPASMTLRTAQTQDFSQLHALLCELNPHDPAASTLQQAVFEQIIATPNLQLLVAETGGRLLGTCYLNIIPNLTRGARPYAVIENVVTAASVRRCGIGMALLRRAVALAWDAGCYKIMLMTSRKDEGLHNFYRRCGFAADDKQAYVIRAE
jgi:GNAT superfamily N-acetyltransferase